MVSQQICLPFKICVKNNFVCSSDPTSPCFKRKFLTAYRTTDLKTNFKGMNDFLECSACGLEEESQKHILECSVLLSLNEESEETPKYENLFEGEINDQMKIAKLFIKNMEIKTNLSKND